MIREKEFEFVSQCSGRVDAIASSTLDIPRTVFSLSSLVLRINGKDSKKSSKVKEGDKVYIRYEEQTFENLDAEDISLDVIYEDDDILVINKEQGMAVHPGAGNYNGTLANALLGRYGEDFEAGDDDLRPGIVHRLDKDTSGVMVVAKNQKAHQKLSEMFAAHSNEKYYLAIAKGFFPESKGTIERRICRDRNNRKRFTVTDNKTEGKDALTKYKVLSQGDGYALLRVRIYTGRTHQIRVHLTSIGHPILGDSLYSRKDNKHDVTMMLHSALLSLEHPTTGERMVFRAPLPERFEKAFEALSITYKPSEAQ